MVAGDDVFDGDGEFGELVASWAELFFIIEKLESWNITFEQIEHLN